MEDVSEQRQREILKVLVGSRAHHLSREDSDYDYRAVFVVPTVDFLRLGAKVKNTSWVEGTTDEVAWELGHFLKMAVHCNPNIIDVFMAPIESADLYGKHLRNLLPAVLSRKRAFEAYLGYSKNQQKKLMDQDAADTPVVWRSGVTYIRALLNGIDLLLEGKYEMEVAKEWRDFLMDVRAGKVSRGTVIDEAVKLQRVLYTAWGESTLPNEPNLAAVNEFLLRVRKENWN